MSEQDDIVWQLRTHGHGDPLCRRAADEIERLRAEIADMIAERKHEEKIVREERAADRSDAKWHAIYGDWR
jgi:hypothetical protein